MIVRSRISFAELEPRERITALVDTGSFRELLGPFARLSSPYLAEQNVAAQRDDGVIVGRARIDGHAIAAVAIDGRFLGGSIGEVGGAKIARVLERAESGALLILDTGGIRLQEANLGILAVAEICDAVVALRTHAPVVALIAGRVGCYGGMSLVASLCSRIIMTPVGRFGLNGPEVVEQEAGIDEFDARDRPMIWALTGGKRRAEQGHIETLVDDDTQAVAAAVRSSFGDDGAATRERLDGERLARIVSEVASP